MDRRRWTRRTTVRFGPLEGVVRCDRTEPAASHPADQTDRTSDQTDRLPSAPGGRGTRPPSGTVPSCSLDRTKLTQTGETDKAEGNVTVVLVLGRDRDIP